MHVRIFIDLSLLETGQSSGFGFAVLCCSLSELPTTKLKNK